MPHQHTMNPARQQRLKKAVSSSYRRLRPYREAVVKLTEEYAGPMYGVGTDGPKPEKYVNMSKQAVSAYQTVLASNRPRVLLTSKRKELDAFADHFQGAINQLLKEIKIERLQSQMVRDAYFWMAVVKVHMGDSGEIVAEGDLRMDPGKPFASNIALDNFVFDMNANSRSEIKFAGDLYRLPIEMLQDSGAYSGEALEDLEPADRNGSDRVEGLSSNSESSDDDLDPMADVCDIWIPRDGKIYTYVVSNREELTLKGDPIAEMPWRGSELGPYHLLHFDEVSENVLPSSTAADLYPLDRLINNLYRKNANKARRQKDTPVFEPSATDTAKKLQRASDGEWCAVNNPKEVNVIKHGGMDGNLHGFMLNSMQTFDRMAGNLQAMLGLGASTDTVGQEELMYGASSRREDHLRAAVQTAMKGIVADLGYLLWNDDFTVLPNRVELEGLEGISYDSTWRPGDREGEFDEYEIDIDIFSMQYQGPGSRERAINQLLMQMYLPLVPIIQQQGGSIDVAKLVELHSEMLNLPRLKDIVLFNSPPSDPAVQQDGPPKPPSSNRTYTRRNVSGESDSVPDASEWLGQSET